jgi:hypothetical protein
MDIIIKIVKIVFFENFINLEKWNNEINMIAPIICRVDCINTTPMQIKYIINHLFFPPDVYLFNDKKVKAIKTPVVGNTIRVMPNRKSL